ncbi:unnamed protein product [Paramecium sonneborni]|uniref:Uncharacterized protein n=1 Tax=Paramecium sonneborni TaxID=65129 RepID=A0A8S1QLR4_9CILI|nr:unnamed protein product [Paramecium sonneborni]CAD8115569.1 unnamed protein product [Paramecium sonneborni]
MVNQIVTRFSSHRMEKLLTRFSKYFLNRIQFLSQLSYTYAWFTSTSMCFLFLNMFGSNKSRNQNRCEQF